MAKHEDRVAHNTVPLIFSLITLPCAIAIWFSAVSRNVQEPYLDEVFHVGQGQTYCQGKFTQWDPKITTPPGLYLVSWLYFNITGRCDLDALRILNTIFLFAIFFFLLHTAPPVSPRSSTQLPGQKPAIFFSLPNLYPQQIHSALNICLFPPLFFFCALYYTDVGSTLFVLIFVRHFIEIHSRGPPSFLQACKSILLGVFALSFRQTNIFWVAVFPIVFILTSTLHEQTEAVKHSDVKTVIHKAWGEMVLYDPQIRNAAIEDFGLCAISLVTLTLRSLTTPTRLPKITILITPYLILLATFGAFVVWNGGVVLGDKSNHVATIHLPQMLYLWAYTSFFSLPLIYPFVMQALLAFMAGIPIAAYIEPLLIFNRRKILPRPLITIAFIILSMLAVRYNTIVHPFTLADNRHYTFYVFRILFKHPLIKYLAVPVYIACAWSVCQCLGAPAHLFQVKEKEKDDSSCSDQAKQEAENDSSRFQLLRLNDASFGEGSTVSFILVWMAVTALQLVTAPLVEPRYFILPWIMWRLRVPQAHPGAAFMSWPTHNNAKQWFEEQKAKGVIPRNATARRIWSVLWLEHDHRLWLETIWFAVINIATGWIFLNWGFEWEQEPGKVQRFMW